MEKMLRVFIFAGLCATLVLLIPAYGYEADADLNLRLSQLKSTSEFCAFMGFPDDCEDILNEADVQDVDGKMVVAGKDDSKMALYDSCNPRNMTIALPRSPDPDVTIWPTCTRAVRCGGCCTSDVFSCEPTEIRVKFVKIFDTRLPYPGAQRFQFLGVRKVKIIEHTQCDAQCKTKAHECHSYQVYEPRICRCVCREERDTMKNYCNENQIWDDSECDCICPNRATAFCPEPSYFSTRTCKCTLKMGVSGEIDLVKVMEHIALLEAEKEMAEEEKNPIDSEIPTYTNLTDDTETEGNTETEYTDAVVIEEALSTNTTEKPKEKPKEKPEKPEKPKEKPEKPKEKPKTTTTTSTTTKSTTTTTPKPKPKPKEDPCAWKRCFGRWKPRLLEKSKVCQCQPPFNG